MSSTRNLLSRGFTLVEALMIVVAIIGILAAVAIPAFMKYIRRSKTVEATMNLRKLFDSSVSYFDSEQAAPDGTILAKQFVQAVAWQPPQGGACAQTGQKFVPVPSYWASPTWQALNFGMDDPHYFSYQVTNSGSGAGAGDFTNLEASADLSCNAIYSLYRRTATVAPDFSLRGGSGIYSERPIE